MTVREYIGARYVPVFADPIDWDSSKTYEPLTVVYYQGNSFTSRQAVPAGIDITNTTYWALTGNYNAQIEQYRAEVQTFDGRITQNTNDIAENTNDIAQNTNDIAQNTNDIAQNTNDIAEINTEIETFEQIINQRLIPFNYSGKNFVFLGDSITIGQSGPGTFYETPWPKTVCDITGANYYNYAVGGATFQSSNVEVQTNFREQIRNINITPDYVFIMFGTNDYGLNAELGDFTGNSDYDILTSAMINGIHAIRNNYPQAVVIGLIPPYMPGDTVRNGKNLTALDYKTTIKNQYDILNVPTIDFTAAMSLNNSNWQSHIWDTDTPRLHPNQETHNFMGRIVAGMLPSICNRIYTMLAARTFSGNLTLLNGATGSIQWWIDEQNNVHIYSGGVVAHSNDTYVVAELPVFLRPQVPYYSNALDLNTGDNEFVYFGTNGVVQLRHNNTQTCFDVTIPQLLRSVNTMNIR